VKQATKRALLKAAEAIGSADELALACHISPDGDALGSVIAMAHAAVAAGKQVVASFGSPFVVSDTYDFLDLSVLVPPDEFPAEPQVMVVFDVAAADRLGELTRAAERAGTLVVVDHHVTNEGFGDVVVVDPGAAAAAQLAYYLIGELGWPMSRQVATALLAGIVSDTGRFQYSCTDAEVLRVAACLVDAGARPEEIGQNLYESAPFGYLYVSAAVLGRARLEEELSLVWSVLYEEDMSNARIGPEDVDPLIDDLRIVRGAEVAALVKETAAGWKVSLRSRGGVDVGAIAAAEGGGGHHNAAGFSADGEIDGIVAGIRAHLRG
jgi:phosphoesterase RecJ-like protein